MDILKGNYKSPELKTAKDAAAGKDDKAGFEQKAMERLGGSIAFVMKSKTFMWTEEQEGEKK